MAKHKVITTNADINGARERANSLTHEPRLLAVEYRSGRGLDLLILTMSDGHRQVIPREDIQGLQSATRDQIDEWKSLAGVPDHWPALNLDHYVPNLLRQQYGTKRWMAQIGRRGGSSTSPEKKSLRAPTEQRAVVRERRSPKPRCPHVRAANVGLRLRRCTIRSISLKRRVHQATAPQGRNSLAQPGRTGWGIQEGRVP